MRMVLLRALRSAGRLVERSDVLFCFTVQRKDRLPKSMPTKMSQVWFEHFEQFLSNVSPLTIGHLLIPINPPPCPSKLASTLHHHLQPHSVLPGPPPQFRHLRNAPQIPLQIRLESMQDSHTRALPRLLASQRTRSMIYNGSKQETSAEQRKARVSRDPLGLWASCKRSW
jgi:hypothetical protein